MRNDSSEERRELDDLALEAEMSAVRRHSNPNCSRGPWCECDPPEPDPILEGRIEP